jgi:glycosyltransferase involved in cell wall biosynthesis
MRLPVVAVIPALNAERTISAVVRDSLPHVDQVLVIDDGSTDATGAVAAEAGATVIRHAKNRGKGAALKTGFQWASNRGYDGVITLDADGQHLAAEIPKFLASRVETQADLIIGERSHLFPQMVRRRRMANRFSAWTISKVSGVHIRDSQSGFRFYSSDLLRRIRPQSNGFDMESEVIVRAGRTGLRVMSIPIELGFVDGLSTSHYKPMKDTLLIAWTVLRTLVLR